MQRLGHLQPSRFLAIVTAMTRTPGTDIQSQDTVAKAVALTLERSLCLPPPCISSKKYPFPQDVSGSSGLQFQCITVHRPKARDDNSALLIPSTVHPLFWCRYSWATAKWVSHHVGVQLKLTEHSPAEGTSSAWRQQSTDVGEMKKPASSSYQLAC